LSVKDYYSILGVHKNASERTIHEAYKRLVKRYHPDFNPSPEALEILKEINEAYEVLTNPDLRPKYDNTAHETRLEPAYYRPPAYESNTQRLNRLTKENVYIFAWCCKIGLTIAILIGFDVLIPPQVSSEEIADMQYRTSRGRGRYHWVEIYTYHRSFKIYPGGQSQTGVEVGKVVKLKISRLFRNVLSIQGEDSTEAKWVARLYTNLSFFPIILFIASLSGVYFKDKIDWVLSFGTVSFATGSICLVLAI